MTRTGDAVTIGADSTGYLGGAMATTLAPEEKHDDWVEMRAVPGGDPLSARAAWLWTMFGLALLGTFLAFVVEDFPLRSVFAGQ